MIYCVEDDSSIRDLMVYALRAAGFSAVGCADGEEFWQAMHRETPELVILDIMLPGEDGISILKKLRAAPVTADIPVIMATAKGTEYDRVIGLDLGADDYLTKPFGMMEMVSRIRAVLRRAGPKSAPAVLRQGSILMDEGRHVVEVNGTQVTLTLKEYDLLRLLLENPGQVFSRDRLLSAVWGTDYYGETRTVDVHIGTLRTKLGAAGDILQTVRGVGYKLEAAMSKKIFRSIWLAALIVLVLSLVLIMGVLYSYFTGVQQKQLRMGAEVVAQGVTLDGKEFFDGLTAEDYRITWIDADGTVLYDNQSDASSMENHLMRAEVQQALQNGTGESSRYSDTLASRNLYCARLLPDDTIIRLSAAQHSVWVLLVGFAQPICVILLLALVLSFLLASRLSRTIVEPINSLNLDEPSQYVGREEYAEIEPLLRRMALQQAQIRQDQDKLEKSSQIRQEFTANVSHELKTPLHAISGYAELMENGMVQQQDIKPFAHKIRQESLRLTALVEDIINLTKLDGGSGRNAAPTGRSLPHCGKCRRQYSSCGGRSPCGSYFMGRICLRGWYPAGALQYDL